MKTPVGILGGTFDPPHLGHTTVASEIKKILGLETVYLMPNHIPPHKAPASATDEHRAAMVKLICSHCSDFRYLDTEIRLGKTSYLSETMIHLAEDPDFSQKSIFFIIGADSLVALHKWHNPDEIFRYCNMAVASRPGYDTDLCDEHVRKRIVSLNKLDPEKNGQIVLTETSLIRVSSTMLRNNPAGISPETVDPMVVDYIRRNNLYHA